MKACAICDDQTSLLTCKHVGPICFDCWGSGIHEVMKRGSSAIIDHIKWVRDFCSIPLKNFPKCGMCGSRKGVVRFAGTLEEDSKFICFHCDREVAS